jgi:coiled-coil domain-containing protein 130
VTYEIIMILIHLLLHLCRSKKRGSPKRSLRGRLHHDSYPLGVRLLPPSAEDAAAAASVKFASKFEKSRKDKRAAIKAASIFPESSTSASKGKLDLALKRRSIKAGVATALMAGRVKPSVLQAQGRRCRFWQRGSRQPEVHCRK